MSKIRTSIFSLFFLFSILLSIKAHAQSNIPIDSPRGSYQGAENIHWYQQKALKVSANQGLPPFAGEEFECNQKSLTENCFGETQREPQEAYYIQGRAPVLVAVFVDARSTSGFDYPFRRAIDAIRRTNDAFSRSGVNAFLYITEVRFLDFDARGYTYDALEIYNDVYSYDIDLLQSTARNDKADIVVFIRNTQGRRDQSGDWCGSGTPGVNRAYDYLTPLVILTCEDAVSQRSFAYAPSAAPHEVGHVFGLAHESTAAQPLVPHLRFGRAYLNEAQNISSIMSTEGDRSPFFSSPLVRYRGISLGEKDNTDSVTALNQSAANVALYWERRWGELAPVGGAGSPEGPVVSPSQTQSAKPGSLIAPGIH